MKLKLTKITETQYKMSTTTNTKYFKEIDLLYLKISHTYNLLTSFNKTFKSPIVMLLEDHQFRWPISIKIKY